MTVFFPFDKEMMKEDLIEMIDTIQIMIFFNYRQ